MRKWLFIFVLTLAGARVAPAMAEFIHTGWIENMTLTASNFQLEAKIDTGARDSSLHCGCEFFRKGFSTWARIKIKNKQNQEIVIERPVLRFVDIKRHGLVPQRRAVVELDLCLGGITKRSEVNLSDRAGFNYALLVGRSFLADDFLVNAARKNLLNAECL